jgi:Flp pilus assembly protein TadB|tara:strand:+ start:124 stop:387 length:264 start_codon:yes stop_codon:yes gene_type:complete
MKHTREYNLKGLGDLIMDKDRVKYIYQYLFLIAVIFVGVPLFLGGYTTSGLCLNLAVVHVLFVWLVRHKEKERTERIRQKRLKELTQ